LFKYAGGYGGRFGGDIDLEHFQGTRAFPIVNYFGDYRSWGGELGFRYFLFSKDTMQPWHLRPYVTLSGGATYVESIYVAPRYVADGYDTYVPAFEGNLYGDSIVGTVAGMLGFEVPITCHWSIGVEAGVRYESELESTDVIRRTITDYDPDRATAESFHYRVGDNAGHYNSDGSRLYCPVNGYLKFRF
jgi:hypothetical protein